MKSEQKGHAKIFRFLPQRSRTTSMLPVRQRSPQIAQRIIGQPPRASKAACSRSVRGLPAAIFSRARAAADTTRIFAFHSS
jgi:hypothetical protein